MRHAAVYDEGDLAEDGPELSLGMGTLLGIFFGLALVCGVFFGFGYMMGHRTPGTYVSSEPLYVAPRPAENPIRTETLRPRTGKALGCFARCTALRNSGQCRHNARTTVQTQQGTSSANGTCYRCHGTA